MLFTIFLIGVLLGLVYLYFSWHFNHWKNLNIPGPKPTIVLGNMPGQITQKQNIAYDIDDIYQAFRKKDVPFVGIFIIRTPNILVLSPTLVKDIFVKNFNYFHDSELSDMVDREVDPIFGRNPIMLTGDEWKEKRAEITPAFTPARIKAMSPLIDDVCGKMIKYIKAEIVKQPENGLDAKELSAKFTTDVVSSCIFAVDAKSFSNSENEAVIRKMGKTIFATSLGMMIYFILISAFPFIMKLYKRPMVSKKHVSFFTDLMRNAVKYRREQKIDRVDYLDHLINLKDKKGITELDMAAHGVTFFIDGFETSSLALSQTLYEIARNPEVQTRLRREIIGNSDNDGKISFDKVQELPYLEQVFAETMRLYPSLILSRKCTETIEVEFTGNRKFTIEKGMNLILPSYSIHRDAEYYPEPEKFDPERFAAERGGVKAYQEKGTYFPFGAGPRACLGRRFAVAQVKLGVVEIVRNFEVSVNPKTKEPLTIDPVEFLFTVKGGVWLNFKEVSV